MGVEVGRGRGDGVLADGVLVEERGVREVRDGLDNGFEVIMSSK